MLHSDIALRLSRIRPFSVDFCVDFFFALLIHQAFEAYRHTSEQSLTCPIHIYKALVGLISTFHHLSHNFFKETAFNYFFIFITL